MYYQITDLADQATNLRDKIYAFSVMVSSLVTTERNQTHKDQLQGGISLFLDDLAADAEALLSNIDLILTNCVATFLKNDNRSLALYTSSFQRKRESIDSQSSCE